MRKLIVCNIMSLDGHFEGPGGNVMALFHLSGQRPRRVCAPQCNPGQRVQEPRVLRFRPPEIGVLVGKQKHDSGRKKLDQRRSKEKRESGGKRGDRAAFGKDGSRRKR
jgi:hypothetical protein